MMQKVTLRRLTYAVAAGFLVVVLAALLYAVVGLQSQQRQSNQIRAQLLAQRNEQIAEVHSELCAAVAAIPAADPVGFHDFEQRIRCPLTVPIPYSP